MARMAASEHQPALSRGIRIHDAEEKCDTEELSNPTAGIASEVARESYQS